MNIIESLQRTAEAEEEFDECPECGEEYVGLDTTATGDLFFVHSEDPLKGCTHSDE